MLYKKLRNLIEKMRRLWRSPPPPKSTAVACVSRTDDREMWTAYAEMPALPPPPGPIISATRLPASLKDLERRRRKHDKFVTPQGPSIPPKPKPKTQEIVPKLPRKPKPAEADAFFDATETYIAERHHEDTEKVLYSARELYGEFTFRDTILQQLDRYFFYLSNMRKSDPPAYTLYRQVGAQILPYLANGSWHRDFSRNQQHVPIKLPPLSKWFHETRPSFGCFAYGADPETERCEIASRKGKTMMWVPKFMYYTKYKKAPPELQRMAGAGDVYVLSLWWHTPADPHNKHNYGTRQDIGFFVPADGSQVIALRTCSTVMIPINGKDKGQIPQRGWRLGHDYEVWAKSQGHDPYTFLADIFLTAIQRQEASQYSMVQVHVRKGSMTAVFGVNHERMSYFFQDRDVHLTEEGRRKPIFHAVRAHSKSDGTIVPLKFRGERNFTWAGYDVQITVPGKDHVDPATFDVGGVDEHWEEKDEAYVGMGAVGKMFADNVKGAPLREALAKMQNKKLH